MAPAEEKHLVRIAKAVAWLNAYACELDPEQLAALNNNHVFTMACPEHGNFPWSWVRARDYAAEAPCPGCRLEAKVGGAVLSVNDAIRYATNHTRWARQQAVLLELQQDLDTLHGLGVIGVGDADYVNKDAYRDFVCGVNPDHPPFATTPRRLLNPKLRRGAHRCPRCAEEALGFPSTFNSAVRRPGGYLYRIRNIKTGDSYIGLTTLTPEIRYAGHQSDASKGVRKSKFYIALKANPHDFQLEPIAYFFNTETLKSAEIQTIAEENTRFPNGYNLSNGGELYPIAGRGAAGTSAKRVAAGIVENREAVVDRMLVSAGISDLSQDDERELKSVLLARLVKGTRAKSLICSLKRPQGVDVLLGRISPIFSGQSGHPALAGNKGKNTSFQFACSAFGKVYPSLKVICEEFRVDRKKLRKHVQQGISLETALLFGPLIGPKAATPIPPSRQQAVVLNGVGYPSFKALCKAHDVSTSAVRRRLNKGRTLAEAVGPSRPKLNQTAELAKALGVSVPVAARLRAKHGSYTAALAKETPETLAARVGSVKGDYVTWAAFYEQCLEHLAGHPGQPICMANGASSWLVGTQRKFRHRYHNGEMSPEQRAFVAGIPGFLENTFAEAQAVESVAKQKEAVRAVELAGGKLTMREIAKNLGIDRRTLRHRLQKAEKLKAATGAPQAAAEPIGADSPPGYT